jgi:hypothetical protein
VPESETKVVNQQIICNNPDCSKIAHGDWPVCYAR